MLEATRLPPQVYRQFTSRTDRLDPVSFCLPPPLGGKELFCRFRMAALPSNPGLELGFPGSTQVGQAHALTDPQKV